MPQFSPEHQNAGCQISTESTRLLQLEQDNEILREQILTLERELRDIAQHLLDMERELEYANNEMCEMNSELIAVLESESLTLARAMEVAKIIGSREKFALKPLAELLSAIYGSPVEASALELEEMPQTELSGAQTNEIRRDELMSRVREQKNYANELKVQLTALWNQRQIIRAQTANIIAQNRQLKKQK